MTNPRKTILLISHDADLVTLKTFAALGSEGFNILMATPDVSTVTDVNITGVKTAPIKSKFTLAAIRNLRHIIKRNHVDAVFAVSTSALSNALFATIGTTCKVIGYRGTQALVRPLDPTYYMALLNPRVNHIVCETSDIEDYLTQYIPHCKLSTHPKPYDRSWVEDAVNSPIRPENGARFEVSYVGITDGRPHKGLTHLLAAMKLLDSEGFDCHLTIVGKASERDMATAPSNVTFTGNRPDAIRYIAGSDLFVLPSLRDASPRVVREAQACGLPCVVTDIPGARDLIIADGEQVSGVLVPPADSRALADAIRGLADDEKLRTRMGENALSNIDENYRFDDYVRYFADTLNNVLK